MKRYRASVLGLIGLIVVGCGGVDGNTAKTTGTVTVGGAPMEGLTVTFHPESGRPGVGSTDSQGRFTITTFAANDGAVAGNHKVSILKGAPSSDEPPPMPGTPEHKESEAPPPPPFAAKYLDKETSGLTAVVVKGKSNDFKFDLEKAP